MLISTRGRYALRMLVDLAEHQAKGYVPLRAVAQRQDISEKYLESIVKSLVKEDVLCGIRGKGGGYRLSKPADQITVGYILRLTEGSLAPVICLEQGARRCPRMADCRTLPMWRGLDEMISDYLDDHTIADLVRVDESGNDYII